MVFIPEDHNPVTEKDQQFDLCLDDDGENCVWQRICVLKINLTHTILSGVMPVLVPEALSCFYFLF
jgi:hypothetical protein